MRLNNFLFIKSIKIFTLLLYKLIPTSFYFLKSSSLNIRDLYLYANKDSIGFLISFLKSSSFFRLNQLNDISTIDFLKSKTRFKIIYNLSSLSFNTRFFVSSFLNSSSFLLSLSFLFKSSCWLEREVWDMFGIVFRFQKDLRRILTDYGFKGFPLRKDFPLTGYTEVRFDSNFGDVIYEPLELSQELRMYTFSAGWQKNY